MLISWLKWYYSTNHGFMENKVTDKKELRRIIRERKKQMSDSEKLIEKESVFFQVEQMKVFKEAERIICYWSLPDELDTHDFVLKWYSQKQIYLPRVVGDEVELVLFNGLDHMKTGAFGILEPIGDSVDITDNNIEIIIIPGVAFTKDGWRIGRGGGYYDRLLPQLQNTYKVGIGYSSQVVENLPVEEHDVKMDCFYHGGAKEQSVF